MIINFNRRVQEWQNAGVIDSETSERIRAFEARREGRSWVVFGIAAVGVVALLTGITSIVAANWDFISGRTKLASYFVLQALIGLLFLRSEHRPGVWRELCLITFACAFMAGIGLVGQTYNLSGPWWETLSFWLLLALLPACFAQSRPLPLLWSIGSLLAVLLWLFEATPSPEATSVGCALAAPYVLICASLGATVLGVLRHEFRSSLIITGVGALLVPEALLGDFAWNNLERAFPGSAYLLIPWAAALTASVLSVARRSVPARLRATTAALMLLAVAYLTLPQLLAPSSLVGSPVGELIGAIGFMAVWSLAAAAAALASMRYLFNIASFVLATRIVVAYFQVFGSLTTTGIGLVVTGLFIISVALLWNRGRRALRTVITGES